MSDVSDDFTKVLEGADTSDAGKQPEQQVGDKGTSVPQPSVSTVKVGDKEYSTEDLEKKLQLVSEVEDLEKNQNINFKELKSEFTKRSTRLKELEDKVKPIEQAFDKSREQGQEELPEDYETVRENAKRYKLLTEDAVKPLMEKISTLEQKLTEREKEELRADLEEEVTGLTSKYEFVKWSELQPFMISKANAGANLSPEEAARLLYPDQFALIRAKELGGANPTIPQVDANGRSNGDVPSPKKLDFDTGGVSDALEESLNTNPVQ